MVRKEGLVSGVYIALYCTFKISMIEIILQPLQSSKNPLGVAQNDRLDKKISCKKRFPCIQWQFQTCASVHPSETQYMVQSITLWCVHKDSSRPLVWQFAFCQEKTQIAVKFASVVTGATLDPGPAPLLSGLASFRRCASRYEGHRVFCSRQEDLLEAIRRRS